MEDVQRDALMWHKDQKRHTWPGLLLMMTSRRETLHFDNLHILVEKLFPTVVLVQKLMCWWWWIVSLVRERNEVCFIDDYQQVALMWHKDQKRHAWPGLLLMMTLRRETLHFDNLYLSHETLVDCHVSPKTDVLMMMDSFVSERERNEVCFIDDYQQVALMWHKDQKRHAWPGLLLMMTLRRETLHFDNLHILVMKLCPTLMLVRKLLCWWWWIVPWMREKCSLLHWRLSETCFDMTSRSETTHLTGVATDDVF